MNIPAGPFLAFVAEAMPEAVDLVRELVTAFRQTHPELVAPPPADEEAAVNARLDAELDALEDETTPAPKTDPSP